MLREAGFLFLAGSILLAVLAPSASADPGYLLKWGSQGSGPGQFNEPSGIAVDASGNVYVADKQNHRIQKFDADGNTLTQWGTLGTGNGEFDSPRDVAVGPSGFVYVVDQGNLRVQKFSSTGVYQTQWGSSGTLDGQFLNPRAIAVDAGGQVYVTDDSFAQKRVQKFTDTGAFVAKWGSSGTGNGQFLSPRGIDVDNAGYVYVTDSQNDRVQKFTDSGSYVTQWGVQGSGQAEFNIPIGIACTGSDLFIVDSQNHRIQQCTTGGAFLLAFGSRCEFPGGAGCVDPDGGGPQETGDGQVWNPQGSAVNSTGDIYVVDTDNHRIQKFGEALQVGIADDSLRREPLAVFPNPTTAGTSIQFVLGGPDGSDPKREVRVEARVYDISGRPVKQLFSGSMTPGTRSLRWSGDTDSGSEAAPGIYWIQVLAEGEPHRSSKVVRVP